MTINFICDLMGYFNVLYKNKLLNECYIYIYIAHLQQEYHNSKFGIFELLV